MTTPAYGSTQAVAATAASANIALNAPNRATWKLQVLNAGTTVAFVNLGTGAGLTATAADYPIPPNCSYPVVLNVSPGGADRLAAIMSSGTGTLYVTAIAE